MAEKQANERKATRFDGVYQRPSRTKRYEGKPDVTYMIDYYDPHSGKRIRKTLGNRSQGITAEYANTVRQKLMSTAKTEALEGIVPISGKKAPTLHEAWLKYKEDWLEAHEKASTYNDIRNYETHLKESAINDRPLNQITVQDLEKIAKDMRAKHYAAQTIVGILGQVRRIMNRAAKWKMWRGISPFEDFTMPEVDNDRTRYYTAEQIGQIFQTLREKNHRAWLFSLIALQCGLRFGDIASLEHNDINFEDNTLFIRKPKNRKSRYVSMTQTVREALIEWISASQTHLVFPSSVGKRLWNMDDDFREVVNELGFNNNVTENKDKLVFHSLRHTFGSVLAKDGYSEIALAKLLGHKSTAMTRRYAHLMPETQKAAAEQVESVFSVSMEHPESPK